MAQILKPPTPLPAAFAAPTLFLAGSIAMGRPAHGSGGREELCQSAITILNPRRDDWDATWIQELANPQFRAQVEWELEAQERADLIIMYFAPETQAPITLLELGLFARSESWRSAARRATGAKAMSMSCAPATEFPRWRRWRSCATYAAGASEVRRRAEGSWP
jgi:hypothetical protein